MIQLTPAQRNLLSRLNVNISTGLSTSEADSRRRINNRRPSSSASSYGNTTAAAAVVANIVTPPINCPKWICCLLPCISKTRSMIAFAAVAPDDAEVLRNARWVRYDASCLVVGDVLRLDVHDVVPADCVIIAHGFRDELLLVGHESEETGHGEDDDDDDDDEEEEEEKSMIQSKAYAVAVDNNDNYEDDEEVGVLSVDARLITGQSDMTHYHSPPSSSMSSTSSSKSSLQTLLYGSRIVNGSCIAIVTAIGNDVVLSKLITTRRWPPKYDMSHEIII